ncbi:uncharacterized protein [Maniola hyperantus]|uniref:uncharacterized protein n=1 Tax=Aphantopus hyperantus TaxID=2795564 RepID=UPI0037493D69
MEQQAKDHTCDAYHLIEPKEEMLEDLEVADEGDDDKDFIVPKEELSNSSPHLEQWNDQQVSMLMPIKIKTILSKEIVELQKVFKSSEDTEVSARCLRTHINLEPTESYLLHASLPTDGAQTLGARLPMIHTTGKDKAVHQTWGTEASTQDTEHMYTAGPGVLCPQPELGCSQLTPTAVLNVGQKDGAASQSSNLSNKTMVFITERASHPSRAQIESLLEYLERNPSLAKGFSKVPCARDAARRSWEALALQLNSLGGCVKTSKQWIKYWADKKSAVKKKGALRYRARNKTGGEAEAVELNELEEKILLIMGGESFATGHRHLEINPFEYTSSSAAGNPRRAHGARRTCAACVRARAQGPAP